MNLDLSNKTALVCGSTQGIGQATAIALSKMGATVFILARNQQKLDQTLKLLDRKKNQEHRSFCADFSNVQNVKTVADKLKNLTINILVNNTGGPAGGPITEADPKAFIKAFEMHLICNQILTKSIVSGMKKTGFGRIINVISTSVKVPINGLGVSNTVRGAVASWAKTMANELGEFGITVNNVLPGFTNTNRLKTLIAKKAQTQSVSEKTVAMTMLQSVPANRFGEANEVAEAIAYLCSPSASYINGINLPVDGGRTGTL